MMIRHSITVKDCRMRVKGTRGDRVELVTCDMALANNKITF